VDVLPRPPHRRSKPFAPAGAHPFADTRSPRPPSYPHAGGSSASSSAPQLRPPRSRGVPSLLSELSHPAGPANSRVLLAAPLESSRRHHSAPTIGSKRAPL